MAGPVSEFAIFDELFDRALQPRDIFILNPQLLGNHLRFDRPIVGLIDMSKNRIG